MNVLQPSTALLVKLGSIARHAEELLSPGAHPFDADAIRSLLADPEVREWFEAADALALIPVARAVNRQSQGKP
jgi:hypothetical protein